jgi:hypothetical protein
MDLGKSRACNAFFCTRLGSVGKEGSVVGLAMMQGSTDRKMFG